MRHLSVVCGVVVLAFASALTQETLRSAINANPIISRLSNYEIVRPVMEDSLFSALDASDSEHDSMPASISYSLSAFGRSFKLQLRKNDDLVAPSYQEMR